MVRILNYMLQWMIFCLLLAPLGNAAAAPKSPHWELRLIHPENSRIESGELSLPAGYKIYYFTDSKGDLRKFALKESPEITDADFTFVSVRFKGTNEPYIIASLNPESTQKLFELTKDARGQVIAILEKGSIIDVPEVNKPIEAGLIAIDGSWTSEELEKILVDHSIANVWSRQPQPKDSSPTVAPEKVLESAKSPKELLQLAGASEEYSEKLKIYRRLTEQFPKSNEAGIAWSWIGQLEYERGNKEEAVKAFRTALNFLGNTFDSLNLRLRIVEIEHEISGDKFQYREALFSLIEQIRQIKSNNPKSNLDILVPSLYLKAGDEAQADKMFREISRGMNTESDDYVLMASGMAQIYYERQELSKAYKLVHPLKPQNPALAGSIKKFRDQIVAALDQPNAKR